MANQYHLGAAVQVRVTFTDTASSVQDPGAIFCKTQNPAGVQASYQYGVDASLKKESTGVYYLDVNADKAGWWHYYWYSTGTGQAADEGAFKVQDTRFD